VGSKVVFDYSLKNVGTNVAPEGAYFDCLYVDGHLIRFGRGPWAIQPGEKTYRTMERGYSDWQPTNTGLHGYELVIVQPGKTNRTRGEINVLP
jgi:hypothetical protein